MATTPPSSKIPQPVGHYVAFTRLGRALALAGQGARHPQNGVPGLVGPAMVLEELRRCFGEQCRQLMVNIKAMLDTSDALPGEFTGGVFQYHRCFSDLEWSVMLEEIQSAARAVLKLDGLLEWQPELVEQLPWKLPQPSSSATQVEVVPFVGGQDWQVKEWQFSADSCPMEVMAAAREEVPPRQWMRLQWRLSHGLLVSLGEQQGFAEFNRNYAGFLSQKLRIPPIPRAVAWLDQSHNSLSLVHGSE